ncbi:hypothetical protein ILYODFUR_019084, partial [Ilyodon furcidens]
RSQSTWRDKHANYTQKDPRLGLKPGIFLSSCCKETVQPTAPVLRLLPGSREDCPPGDSLVPEPNSQFPAVNISIITCSVSLTDPAPLFLRRWHVDG